MVCAPRVLCRHDPALEADGDGISTANSHVPISGSLVSGRSRTDWRNRRSRGHRNAPSSLHGKHRVLVIARRRAEPARNRTGEFMSAENSTAVYSGLGAAPGRASGKAYVIRNSEDVMAIPAGSILVLRILHPHLAPLLPRVAGLVVEEGAILQHATTLARECGIPAAVGIQDARNLIEDGELVDVDGYTGKVTKRHVD
ncbi:MAG: hypothetical protein DMF70_06635 [Acidobacteria bacterium]|nr:MAG: hypothetical protein DMF70_06635 [Acidobacteriota bacterium]